MSSKMLAIRLKFVLFFFLTLLIICAVIVARTDYSIRREIREKSFAAPTEYFASPRKFFLGQMYRPEELKKDFNDRGYREREFGQLIQSADFAIGRAEQCAQALRLPDPAASCLTFRNRESDELYLLFFNEWDAITHIFRGENLAPQAVAAADAQAFAQYLGDQPTLQKAVKLAEIPRYCLDAVLAIEDPNFLTHSGVSLRGIMRAVLANLKRGWGSQGGSTITQQLVKNYFLTPEKTITRKIKEMLISLILELRISKDEILETYLNIIYLGQQGVYEVRGYESAAQFFFKQSVHELDLGDCALLAAIVNSPGRYNPLTQPENAVQRRTRVLTKMLELQMISQEEFDLANRKELPQSTKRISAATAPYFIDAVKKQLKEEGIQNLAGMKIYTSFDLRAQQIAQTAIDETLKNLESQNAQIKKNREEGALLQAVLISANPLTGEVSALIGGRSFASSPYNRAIEAHRQVGSVFKPIVYLTALESQTPGGEAYDPLTPIDNSPFKYKYERQVWEPRNYDRQFSGPVPMFFALKESMNVPTARLAIDVGLDKIVDKAYQLGVKSKLQAFPSLALGAFELTPFEVLSTYATLSQMGKKRPLFLVRRVVNSLGSEIYRVAEEESQVGDPDDYAVLIGMMKETLNSGTGRAARAYGFDYFAAGKTGTTSETRDAWFAGFTPSHVAIVWIGYDDNHAHGLTGASGALPIWSQYMRRYNAKYPNEDFAKSADVIERAVGPFELEEFGLAEDKLISTKLIFRRRDRAGDFDEPSEDGP